MGALSYMIWVKVDVRQISFYLIFTEDSWHFRLVSCLQRSLLNVNRFINHVNLLYHNELVHIHCLEWNKVSCNQRALVSYPHNQTFTISFLCTCTHLPKCLNLFFLIFQRSFPSVVNLWAFSVAFRKNVFLTQSRQPLNDVGLDRTDL